MLKDCEEVISVKHSNLTFIFESRYSMMLQECG